MKKHSFVLILLITTLLTTCLVGCSSLQITAGSSDTQEAAEETETQTGPLPENENNILVIEEIAVGLLLVASLVGIVTQRLRVPYTVGLVMIGLALSLQGQIDINVSPDLFLGLLVPPLIYEGAFHLKIKDLRRDLIPILTLALPGILLTTFLVGIVVSWGAGFPLSIALVFGALIAPTDPVAVIALFKSLGVPKRILVLLEGESLFNDGIAIVLFKLMITIAITGMFDPVGSVINFFTVAGGGLAVGLLLAVLISQVIRIIDDPLIETTMTAVLAFGSYLVAEQFHVSGVLAVVAAGIMSGNIGPRGMSPSTRIQVFNFWEIAAFLANSLVFLLIGLEIDLGILLDNWYATLWAILAVLISRFVGVYGFSSLWKDVPRRYKPILSWGALRGAISLALALSLPLQIGPARDEILAMAFGVVLFTLLVQGLTMKGLLQRKKLIKHTATQIEYERRHARAVMARDSYDHLQEMHSEGLVNSHIWELLSAPLKKHADALANASVQALHADPAVEAQQVDLTVREILLIQKNTLRELVQDGIISEQTFTQLTREVDIALTDQRSNIANLLHHQSVETVDEVMTVIVQEQDAENIIASMNRRGIPITRLSSTGGFLGNKNVTLLIGISASQKETVIEVFKTTSQDRVHYPRVTESGKEEETIMIGKATIFTFDVEHFQEL